MKRGRSVAAARAHLLALLLGGFAVPHRGIDASVQAVGHLVARQRDQGADHHRDLISCQRGQLEGQALPAARGQDGEGVAAGQRGLDGWQLRWWGGGIVGACRVQAIPAARGQDDEGVAAVQRGLDGWQLRCRAGACCMGADARIGRVGRSPAAI
jgi:hypothetical protein